MVPRRELGYFASVEERVSKRRPPTFSTTRLSLPTDADGDNGGDCVSADCSENSRCDFFFFFFFFSSALTSSGAATTACVARDRDADNSATSMGCKELIWAVDA